MEKRKAKKEKKVYIQDKQTVNSIALLMLSIGTSYQLPVQR